MNRILSPSVFAAVLLLAPLGINARAQTPPAPPAAAPITPAPPQGLTEETRVELEQAHVALAQANRSAEEAYRLIMPSFAALPDKKVSLDLKDTKVKDALKSVLGDAKIGYVLDSDIPEDARITVQAKDIQVGTALDIITESAGLGWRAETSDKTTIVRVGKNVRRGSLFTITSGVGRGTSAGSRVAPGTTFTLPPGTPNAPFVYSYMSRETRSSFTCPNCQNQITVVRRNVQPKCVTCGRTFQADWKVCPYDGAKRPETKDDWHFCPICGKPISLDDPALKNDKNDARHTWNSFFGADEFPATDVSLFLDDAPVPPVVIL